VPRGSDRLGHCFGCKSPHPAKRAAILDLSDVLVVTGLTAYDSQNIKDIGWQFMDEPGDESTNLDDDCPLRGAKLTRGEPTPPENYNSISLYKNSHCAGLTETHFARDELAVATCWR
jgi:hypothetical protein